jgi:hypothetical protein
MGRLFLQLGLLSRGLGAGALGCLLLTALAGCADTPDSRNRDVDAVGSIAFSVIWEDNDGPSSAQPRFVCGNGDNEVVEVTAQITNGANTKRPEANWDCWSGHGTLSDVPVGSNYRLTVIGYNSNEETTYCAERIGITVQRGVNDIGAVVASRFETSGHAPAHNAVNVSPENIAFSWDETIGATNYRLQVSESADFSVRIIDELTPDLSHTVTNDVIQPETQYWWRVIPLNIDGMTGYLSPDNIYRFTTSSYFTPLPDDAYEENDTLESAYDLTGSRGLLLSEIDGLGIVNSEDSVDFYRIDLNADVVWLYVDCYHTHADGDIDIALFSSDGTLLAEALSTDDNESIAFDLSTYAGTSYYVGVALVDESDANSYDLQFDYSECPAGDDYGDRVATAVAISTNSAVQGAIECGDDTDLFRFELSSGRTVSIYTEGSTDTMGWLLDSSGTEIDSNDDPNDTNLNFLIQQTLPAGTYYVAVGSFESETGAYELTVLLEPSPPAISGIQHEYLGYFDNCIRSSGETFSGYAYNVFFNYDDPDGDAAESDGADVTVNGVVWLWTWLTANGDGAGGSLELSYCDPRAEVSLEIVMIDGAGLASDPLSIDLTASQ